MTTANREPSKSIYRFLESTFAEGKFMTFESGVSVERGLIRHAVDPAGKRILLVPISDEEFDGFENDSAGGSVHLRKERYRDDGGNLSPYLVFRCESAALNATFAAFIDDVIEQFDAPSDPTSTPTRSKVVLDRWRRLLATRGPGLLSDKIVVGLMAELRVLESLVRLTGPGALDTWTGPDAADHDFVLPSCAVEVKTTLRKTGLEVEINGAGQLTPPPEAPLYLAASRVAFSPNGEESLPEMVEELLGSGVDLTELTRKLERVGYYHARADEYAKRRVDFLEDRFFEIVENFPRIDKFVIEGITQSDRIRHVSYLLDLTDHDPADGTLSAEGLDQFLKEIT